VISSLYSSLLVTYGELEFGNILVKVFLCSLLLVLWILSLTWCCENVRCITTHAWTSRYVLFIVLLRVQNNNTETLYAGDICWAFIHFFRLGWESEQEIVIHSPLHSHSTNCSKSCPLLRLCNTFLCQILNVHSTIIFWDYFINWMFIISLSSIRFFTRFLLKFLLMFSLERISMISSKLVLISKLWSSRSFRSFILIYKIWQRYPDLVARLPIFSSNKMERIKYHELEFISSSYYCTPMRTYGSNLSQ